MFSSKVLPLECAGPAQISKKAPATCTLSRHSIMPHLLRARSGFSAVPLVLSLALCYIFEAFACSCTSERSPEECGVGSIAVHVDILAESEASCSLYNEPGLETKFWDASVRATCSALPVCLACHKKPNSTAGACFAVHTVAILVRR